MNLWGPYLFKPLQKDIAATIPVLWVFYINFGAFSSSSSSSLGTQGTFPVVPSFNVPCLPWLPSSTYPFSTCYNVIGSLPTSHKAVLFLFSSVPISWLWLWQIFIGYQLASQWALSFPLTSGGHVSLALHGCRWMSSNLTLGVCGDTFHLPQHLGFPSGGLLSASTETPVLIPPYLHNTDFKLGSSYETKWDFCFPESGSLYLMYFPDWYILWQKFHN